ncbi:DUF349 domain-containing protein [Timonella sp. A28]|uniref:DUF349 domain-containing protein n=1 Tax=Timonella sp. A28 TaxID=3442640 RepID=UPI003EB6D1EF
MSENPETSAQDVTNDGNVPSEATQDSSVESSNVENNTTTPSTPKPTPSAPAPKPTSVKPAPAAPTVSAQAAAPVDAVAYAQAAQFGRVDADGTVHVKDGETERVVGQYPDASEEEALSLYVRRYLDLEGKVTLFETRLNTADLPIKEIDSTLKKLLEETAEPAAVGDLPGLRTRVAALQEIAQKRREEIEASRAAAKEAALVRRTEIVVAAEKIAQTDPLKIQWRPAGEELRTLLEQWKEAQRSGPRLDKPVEDSLWKRFSHARTTFDRERRHFFAELEKQNSSAKAAKTALVEEAEKLSSSTDWGATAAAYRELMNRWKAAGRANRKDDDALWSRFRAAQDVFFAAREQAHAATDAEYQANFAAKEELAKKAEALLPVSDIAAAKAALRDVQDQWEEIGRVPRNEVGRIEGRLRAVENAIRDAEHARWERTNPETRARAEGALAQLEQSIATLEDDLAKAQARGNERKVKELTESLNARRTWLEQVSKAAEESRG